MYTDPYCICLLDWDASDNQSNQAMSRTYMRCKEFLLPTLFLTHRKCEDTVAKTLTSGADDYVVRPIGRHDLLARIQSVLRRSHWERSNLRSQWGQLSVNFQSRMIYVDGRHVELTKCETSLALHMLRNVGRIMTRPHLIATVWAQNANIDTRKVDVHICAIRRKLNLRPENGWRLASVYGQGYRLEWLNAST
jgi:DNA-binding response OmpR family regulator